MMRVLIVDDEAPARDKLRRWLAEQRRYRSSSANAATAWKPRRRSQRLQPDVVFLDIQMPGMSGLEVAAQLEPDARAAARVRHRLRRARDQGLRSERHRLSTEALRQGSPAQDAGPRCAARRGDAPAALRRGASARRARRPARSERLLVPQGEQLQLIDATSIHWLEADDNYVHVHTAQARYMLRRTLPDLLVQLGEQVSRASTSPPR